MNELTSTSVPSASRVPAMTSARPALPGPEQPDPPAFETLDRLARAITARVTQGVSPHAQYAAWIDWLSHLAHAPGRQLELSAASVHLRGTPCTLCSPQRVGAWCSGPLSAARGRPALCRSCLAEHALRVLAASVSCSGGMVAQGDARDPRHDLQEHSAGQLHGEPVS